MDARRGIAATMAVRFLFSTICLAALARTLVAASHRTPNFEVHAPSGQLARQLGDAAEEYRRTLAIEWLGHELPKWEERCPIHAHIARGAGGETSFYFTRGRVHGWRMEIQGSPERMLDSVLPHEVTHTIFATHFRQPLPRWADEGACTTVEHPGEIARMERELVRFLKTRRGIRFSDMMWMKQYPRDFMPLYAQGHSVAKYLIEQRGKRAFIDFLEDGLHDDDWPRAARKHYGYTHLADMQDKWLDWVRAGRPTTQLASREQPSPQSQPSADTLVVRGQQPDDVARLASTAPLRQVTASDSPLPPPPPAAASGSPTLIGVEPAPVATGALAAYAHEPSGDSETVHADGPLTRPVSAVRGAARHGDAILFQWRASGADALLSAP